MSNAHLLLSVAGHFLAVTLPGLFAIAAVALLVEVWRLGRIVRRAYRAGRNPAPWPASSVQPVHCQVIGSGHPFDQDGGAA